MASRLQKPLVSMGMLVKTQLYTSRKRDCEPSLLEKRARACSPEIIGVAELHNQCDPRTAKGQEAQKSRTPEGRQAICDGTRTPRRKLDLCVASL